MTEVYRICCKISSLSKRSEHAAVATAEGGLAVDSQPEENAILE